MTDHQHVYAVHEDLAESPSGWWYLSFVDPELPASTRFLGGLYVDGPEIVAVLGRIRELGLNPGGEIAYAGVPAEHLPPESDRLRLLSMEELTEPPGEGLLG